MDNEITCENCGHSERWDHGDYFGEKVDFAHHVCGKPRTYQMCGPDCDHSFPGCARIPEHPNYNPDI
ncbi:hypothetical protein [Saccharopolyspora spinosa]|uniref:Uncharacterized protein n=1 Tax=Saccharopolyspora spinosa TaxID=60894 RepID=A0A2N3XSL8_SACSN|nr:hypothetical protein [Saccharopolyspora spinosa]PKW13663.1 hypothetical protein A8926_1211 [Saccharopolyspora spinosa]